VDTSNQLVRLQPMPIDVPSGCWLQISTSKSVLVFFFTTFHPAASHPCFVLTRGSQWNNPSQVLIKKSGKNHDLTILRPGRSVLLGHSGHSSRHPLQPSNTKSFLNTCERPQIARGDSPHGWSRDVRIRGWAGRGYELALTDTDMIITQYSYSQYSYS